MHYVIIYLCTMNIIFIKLLNLFEHHITVDIFDGYRLSLSCFIVTHCVKHYYYYKVSITMLVNVN